MGFRMKCFSDCSGHGVCVDSLCKCDQGWSGYDCSDPAGFMYVVSPHAALGLARMRAKHTGSDPSYHSEYAFFERLMQDGAIRTTRPCDASLVYVPTWIYYQVNNVAFATEHQRVLDSFLRRTDEVYAKTPTERRVFFFSGDKGACGASPGPIYISHWGLRVPRDSMVETDKFHPTGKTDHPTRYVPCADERHIVVPMVLWMRKKKPTETPASYSCDLFFSGSITRGPLYSQGIRRRVYERWKDEPRMCLVNGRAPQSYFTTSRFCLAASGDGFGNRLFQSVSHGCLPLIMQPNVTLPYEELIPYKEFSLHLRGEDIEDLPRLISEVTPHQHARMRQRLFHWRPAFDWRRSGQAYTFLRYALCLRAGVAHCASLVPDLLRVNASASRP